jgi:hypothetical protein
MSDFLSNLIGRSAGSLEVVRPRVPSIYEPYRPAGTFPGTLQKPPAVEVQSELEVEPEGDATIKPLRQQSPRPRRQPGFRAQQEDMETPARPAHVNDEFHVPDTRPEAAELPVLRVTASERKAFPNAPIPEQVMASEAGEVADDTAIVRPSFAPRQNIVSEVLPARGIPSPEAAGASDSGEALIHRSTRVPAQPLAGRPPLKPWLRPLVRKEEISIFRAEPDGPAGPVEKEAYAVLQPPVEEPVFHPPVESPVSKSPAAPPAAVPTNRRATEPTTPLSSPEPSVQVSIGRVEVRAIFPEPAERRAPVPRTRPTVSLDDYLNRQSRSRS